MSGETNGTSRLIKQGDNYNFFFYGSEDTDKLDEVWRLTKR